MSGEIDNSGIKTEMDFIVTPKTERQDSDEANESSVASVEYEEPDRFIGLLEQDLEYSKEKAMSLWAKTQKLPPEYLSEVQAIYSTAFPIEVRHYFAEWVEEQPWNQIDENNLQHEGYAVTLLENILKLIQQKSDELPNVGDFFILKLRFQKDIEIFKEKYENSPLGLVRVVKSCLSLEEALVRQAENPNLVIENQANQTVAASRQITKDIEALQSLVLVTDTDIKKLQDKQEAVLIQLKTTQTNLAYCGAALQQLEQKLAFVDTQIQQEQQGGGNNHGGLEKLIKEKEELKKKESEITQQKQGLHVSVQAKVQEVQDLRLGLIAKYQKAFQALEEVKKKVIDEELLNWKRSQQLSGNGAPIDANLLDKLQSWSEGLAEIIWKNRQQILQFEILRSRLPLQSGNDDNDIVPELNKKITGLLSSLVTSTFIVEQQPPQVLKKESRFTAKIRLLVGGKLNIHMTPPSVKASIISEDQARGLLQNETQKKDSDSGEILNKEGTMEYHEARGELSIQFRNMQLKKIKRADRKGTEAVTEEKFCILFQSDFMLGNGELMFQVWTLSLPVVVTVHGNQECNAMATVIWDNQFAEPGRTPFVVPVVVPWPAMAQLLTTKFQSVTGRHLSNDNLNYLASKVFGGKPVEDYSGYNINWALFKKDSLPGRNFSFWEWFHSIMRLIKDHLKSLWCDGRIIGFISKQQSQEWLQKKAIGTFLCRFSDSELGGVTIAWSAEDPKQPGERQVWNLAPYGTREINIRALADRIKDLPQLTHLYPDIPKHQAFSKYYTTDELEERDREGYIKSHLINIVSTPGGPIDNCNPMSPMNPGSNAPDSPASVYHTYMPGSVSSSTTNNNLMDLQEREDWDSALNTALDYSADDMNTDVDDLNIVDNILQLNYPEIHYNQINHQ